MTTHHKAELPDPPPAAPVPVPVAVTNNWPTIIGNLLIALTTLIGVLLTYVNSNTTITKIQEVHEVTNSGLTSVRNDLKDANKQNEVLQRQIGSMIQKSDEKK
jgi:peptidoglycan hydrolase CwlO-like protein